MNELEEFETQNYNLKKSDGLRKNGAGLIDGVLVIIIKSFLLENFPQLSKVIAISNPISSIFFYVFIIFIIYRFLTILALGKTIGMAILNMRFAKRNEEKLSFKEKTLSAVMIYTNTVDCYHLY